MFRWTTTVDAITSVGNHDHDDPTTEKRYMAFVGKFSHVNDCPWYWPSLLQSGQNQDPRVDRFYTLHVFCRIQDDYLGELVNLEITRQGLRHGYQSCVRLGRGSDKKINPSIRAGAVMQKLPINTKKADR